MSVSTAEIYPSSLWFEIIGLCGLTLIRQHLVIYEHAPQRTGVSAGSSPSFISDAVRWLFYTLYDISAKYSRRLVFMEVTALTPSRL